MKALVLFSGGLDSILAARIIQEMGIEVIALNFNTPFTGRTRGRPGRLPAGESARMLDADYREVYLGEEYLKLVGSPAFGYGKNVNPCIDCKILFINKAGAMLDELGASFLATGEVMGQRPFSQNKPALGVIARRSGFEDLLLRPLSALLLPLTLPEREGWVDRSRLFAFTGRSRTPQIELAERLGIKNYPNAGGGCLLTDREFSRKISDLIDHGDFSMRNVELLKFGRHFRLDPGFKLVVGRDEYDNLRIESMAEQGDYLFSTTDCPGPAGLGLGELTEKSMRLSCGIIARYASSPGAEAEVSVSGGREELVRAVKLEAGEADKFRI